MAIIYFTMADYFNGIDDDALLELETEVLPTTPTPAEPEEPEPVLISSEHERLLLVLRSKMITANPERLEGIVAEIKDLISDRPRFTYRSPKANLRPSKTISKE